VIVSVVGTLIPYLYYNRWPNGVGNPACAFSGVWIDHWSDRDSLHQVYAVIDSKRPSIVMVNGEFSAGGLKSEVFELFPYRAKTRSSENGGVSILSRLPIGDNYIDDLGVDALPGGVLTLKPESCQEIELGVMALVPSRTQETLQRNLITSRRLSSLLRNSNALRIVAAQFSTTPFSQIISIYPEQTRLRSLRYGLGIKNLIKIENPLFSETVGQVFVSREFTRGSYELIKAAGREGAIQYFEVNHKEPTSYEQALIR
jgi:hypothetical protein